MVGERDFEAGAGPRQHHELAAELVAQRLHEQQAERAQPAQREPRRQADAVVDTEGTWTWQVRAFCDDWATWLHNAEIKIPARADVDLMKLASEMVIDAVVPGDADREGGEPERERDDAEAAAQAEAEKDEAMIADAERTLAEARAEAATARLRGRGKPAQDAAATAARTHASGRIDPSRMPPIESRRTRESSAA